MTTKHFIVLLLCLALFMALTAPALADVIWEPDPYPQPEETPSPLVTPQPGNLTPVLVLAASVLLLTGGTAALIASLKRSTDETK